MAPRFLDEAWWWCQGGGTPTVEYIFFGKFGVHHLNSSYQCCHHCIDISLLSSFCNIWRLFGLFLKERFRLHWVMKCVHVHVHCTYSCMLRETILMHYMLICEKPLARYAMQCTMWQPYYSICGNIAPDKAVLLSRYTIYIIHILAFNKALSRWKFACCSSFHKKKWKLVNKWICYKYQGNFEFKIKIFFIFHATPFLLEFPFKVRGELLCMATPPSRFSVLGRIPEKSWMANEKI
jgi:hypothetical protein